LQREDGHEQVITHQALWQHAVAVAVGLRDRGVRPGESVALMLRTEEALATIFRARVPSLREVTTVERVAIAGATLAPTHSTADAPALIQYTSGSTGDPKGVLLSHANILANIRGFGQALGIRPDDVGVSWLPLYHDMGLIGAWLGSLYHGIPVAILSPLAFLARPARWL
jgi:acyl-CoA synthetase (AMP-forming)/AMP-acid ligase II